VVRPRLYLLQAYVYLVPFSRHHCSVVSRSGLLARGAFENIRLEGAIEINIYYCFGHRAPIHVLHYDDDGVSDFVGSGTKAVM
jgi:hypothetical protein